MGLEWKFPFIWINQALRLSRSDASLSATALVVAVAVDRCFFSVLDGCVDEEVEKS